MDALLSPEQYRPDESKVMHYPVYYCGNGENANYPTVELAMMAALRSLDQYGMDSVRVYKITGHSERMDEISEPVCRVSKLEY